MSILKSNVVTTRAMFGRRAKNRGPGKTYPLSANANVLSATFHFRKSTFCSNDNVSMGVTLACYQQAGGGGGSSRKYVGVSGKWVR
jgi:hypothetical protein